MKYLNSFKNFSTINESVMVEPIESSAYSSETVPNLPYSNNIKGNLKEEFLKKLVYICKQLQVKPEWMMINISGESGFDPHVTNSIGATGLIQFTKTTIAGYTDPKTNKPLTTEDLKKMSAVEQLDVVYAYYKHNMKLYNLTSFSVPGDFFAITFYPAIIKQGMDSSFSATAIRNNQALFKRIGGTTKRAYYDYCQRLVNDPESIKKSIENFDSEGFFGEGSGANTDLLGNMVKELGELVGNIFLKNPGLIV